MSTRETLFWMVVALILGILLGMWLASAAPDGPTPRRRKRRARPVRGYREWDTAPRTPQEKAG